MIIISDNPEPIIEHQEEEMFYIDPNTIPRDTFHKSIHDQLTLIKQRDMDIERGIPTLDTEAFISRMEEFSAIRKGLTAVDSLDETEVVFENLLELKRQVDAMIFNHKIDCSGDYMYRLVNTAYIPILRSNDPEPEMHIGVKEIVCTTITFSVLAIIIKLILDWFSGE